MQPRCPMCACVQGHAGLGPQLSVALMSAPTLRVGGGALGQHEGVDPPVSDSDSSEEESEQDSEQQVSWSSWFCSLRGNEFFCEVEEDYIEDDFNLSGLSSQVPYYDYALDMILDNEPPHDVMLTDQQQELLESAAEMLYGLIHARCGARGRARGRMRGAMRACAKPPAAFRAAARSGDACGQAGPLHAPLRGPLPCVHACEVACRACPPLPRTRRRYIVTARGLAAMLEKFKSCDFNRCPRVLCEGQPCLPVGTSDIPGQSTVKVRGRTRPQLQAHCR